MRRIAAHLGVSDATASRTVARLLRADRALLSRDDPSTAEVQVALTDAGRQVLARVAAVVSSTLERAWSDVVEPHRALAAMVRAAATPSPSRLAGQRHTHAAVTSAPPVPVLTSPTTGHGADP